MFIVLILLSLLTIFNLASVQEEAFATSCISNQYPANCVGNCMAEGNSPPIVLEGKSWFHYTWHHEISNDSMIFSILFFSRPGSRDRSRSRSKSKSRRHRSRSGSKSRRRSRSRSKRRSRSGSRSRRRSRSKDKERERDRDHGRSRDKDRRREPSMDKDADMPFIKKEAGEHNGIWSLMSFLWTHTFLHVIN